MEGGCCVASIFKSSFWKRSLSAAIQSVKKKNITKNPPHFAFASERGDDALQLINAVRIKKRKRKREKKNSPSQAPSVVLGVSVIVVMTVSLSFTAHVV